MLLIDSHIGFCIRFYLKVLIGPFLIVSLLQVDVGGGSVPYLGHTAI